MAKATYYGGIAVMSAGFLFLVFREYLNHHISSGAVGGAIAAVIVVGAILIAFADEIKKPISKKTH